MKRVAITTSSFGEYDKQPLDLLAARGLEVILNSYGRTLSRDEIVPFCKDSMGIIAGTESITADVLNCLAMTSSYGSRSSLRVISRCGVGLENVDLDAADRLGIRVFNTPDAPTLAVAELAVSLILNLLRKVTTMDRQLRSRYWQKHMGSLLYGKKVGIIGFGRIGKKVAELISAFGAEIAYADVAIETGSVGYKKLSVNELAGWADIISIHVSCTTRILGEEEFRRMKKGAWIVNTSRGTVIDEEALYQHLKNGVLSGAALDVFEQEPYNGPLRELENVILTPHIGSYAKESRVEMELQAAKNLLEGLTQSEEGILE